MFLSDQDDIWLLDKIEKMSTVMHKNPDIGLLASNVEPFYEGENFQVVNFETLNKKKHVVKICDKLRWIKPLRPGCSMCLRPSKLSGYDQIWYKDYPHDCLLWGLSVLEGNAFLLNETTIKFRRHDTNASSRGGQSSSNRLRILAREIGIIEKMSNYQKQIEQMDNYKLLQKQLELYRRRELNIREKKIIASVLTLPRIRYFGRPRFWLTDIYYCLKG